MFLIKHVSIVQHIPKHSLEIRTVGPTTKIAFVKDTKKNNPKRVALIRRLQPRIKKSIDKQMTKTYDIRIFSLSLI